MQKIDNKTGLFLINIHEITKNFHLSIYSEKNFRYSFNVASQGFYAGYELRYKGE